MIGEVLESLRERLWNAAYHLVREHQTSDDMVHDVYLKVLSKPLLKAQIEAMPADEVWLYLKRVLVNSFIDEWRRTARHRVISVEAFDEDKMIELAVPNDYEKKVDQERLIEMYEAINKLPKEQREVVYLRTQDCSFTRIVKGQQSNINTAVGRMRYAKANLRKALA